MEMFEPLLFSEKLNVLITQLEGTNEDLLSLYSKTKVFYRISMKLRSIGFKRYIVKKNRSGRKKGRKELHIQ